MQIPDILEKAIEQLRAKADDFGNVTPAAMGDALRAASLGDADGGMGFNTAFSYLATGMRAMGVPNANSILQDDYKTALPVREAVKYFEHAIETYRTAKK